MRSAEKPKGVVAGAGYFSPYHLDGWTREDAYLDRQPSSRLRAFA